ncbi:MAG: hypothetical protein WCK90_02145 [archaeon]
MDLDTKIDDSDKRPIGPNVLARGYGIAVRFTEEKYARLRRMLAWQEESAHANFEFPASPLPKGINCSVRFSEADCAEFRRQLAWQQRSGSASYEMKPSPIPDGRRVKDTNLSACLTPEVYAELKEDLRWQEKSAHADIVFPAKKTVDESTGYTGA